MTDQSYRYMEESVSEVDSLVERSETGILQLTKADMAMSSHDLLTSAQNLLISSQPAQHLLTSSKSEQNQVTSSQSTQNCMTSSQLAQNQLRSSQSAKNLLISSQGELPLLQTKVTSSDHDLIISLQDDVVCNMSSPLHNLETMTSSQYNDIIVESSHNSNEVMTSSSKIHLPSLNCSELTFIMGIFLFFCGNCFVLSLLAVRLYYLDFSQYEIVTVLSVGGAVGIFRIIPTWVIDKCGTNR